MATSDAGGAAPRVAWRVVRAAKALVLAVGVYGCFLQLPCGAAAASAVLRVAASLSAQQYLFLVGNAIVIVLVALFPSDDDEASSSSPGAFFSWWWPSEADAPDRYLPFPGAHLVPPTTEAGEEEVFEDKMAVHVTKVRAKPPRRSRSEKAGNGAAGRSSAEAPELRRAESENGRQRQRAVAVAEAEAKAKAKAEAEAEAKAEAEAQAQAEAEAAQVEWWAMQDPEAFRLWIDAFILKQQQYFLREESVASASEKKGAPAAAGAVVAVK